MYKKEIVTSLLQVAENVVMVEDRFYYAPFLYILEEYCVKNGLVVGGNTGIKMTLEKMLENGLGVNDFYYKLFADDHIYDHAKSIANDMYNRGAKVYKLIGMDEKKGGGDDFSENNELFGSNINLVPLHQITEKQAACLAEYGSDKHIYSYLGTGYPWDLPRIKILMKNSAEDSASALAGKSKQTYFHWLIEHKGCALGYIGLHPISQDLLAGFENTSAVINNTHATSLQIRVFIGKPHQGKGYASQAINLLCKSKNFLTHNDIIIWAVNNAANKAACCASKKAGLKLVEKAVRIPSYNKTAKYNIYVCALKVSHGGEKMKKTSKEELDYEIKSETDKECNSLAEDNVLGESKDYSAQMLTNQTLSAKLVRFMEMLKYIYVDTNIKNKLVTIYVNMRPIAEIHKIGKYRDIKLIDLIGPILADTLFYFTAESIGGGGVNDAKNNNNTKNNAKNPTKQNKILCMSHEIQLMELYKFLYNTYPTNEKRSYAEIHNTVQIVIEKIKPTFESKAIGSAENPKQKISSENALIKIIDKTNPLFQIIKENPTKFVITGDYSILGLTKFDIKPPQIDTPRLQILTYTEQLETICERITNLLQRSGGEHYSLPREHNSPKAIMSKFDLKIPNDKFLEKYTIYIVDSENSAAQQSKRIPIADLYNSLDYDVVPFYEEPSGLRYAGIYAIIRFKLIDVYASKLILALGTTNEDFIKAKISTTVSQIFELNEIANKLIIKDPFIVFQKENHAGFYIAENVLRKKLIKDEKHGVSTGNKPPQQERLRKYFPYNKKEM